MATKNLLSRKSSVEFSKLLTAERLKRIPVAAASADPDLAALLKTWSTASGATGARDGATKGAAKKRAAKRSSSAIRRLAMKKR
jgi:hypothetical protein